MKMTNIHPIFYSFCLLLVGLVCSAQQVGDLDFDPQIKSPAYAEGEGPLILIDGAHNNFHTADGRYRVFAGQGEEAGCQGRTGQPQYQAGTELGSTDAAGRQR